MEWWGRDENLNTSVKTKDAKTSTLSRRVNKKIHQKVEGRTVFFGSTDRELDDQMTEDETPRVEVIKTLNFIRRWQGGEVNFGRGWAVASRGCRS